MEYYLRENNRFEILTPEGWSDFNAIKKTDRNEYVKIILESFKEIKCTPEHLLLTVTGFKKSIEITCKDKIITTDGPQSILDYQLIKTEIPISFYDPIDVKLKNRYIANDIINHNCEFLGSSGTLISGWKLKELVDKIPIYRHEGLSQYIQPEENHIYMIICDVSRGKGLDHSAFQVIDVTCMPYQQAASFRDNGIGPMDFAEVIHRVAKGYNNAMVLVEINDMGEFVSHALHYDLGYEHILFTENAGRTGKKLTGFGSTENVDKGIRTTKIVKSSGCSIIKLLIENNQLILYDDPTIMELKTFSKKGTTRSYTYEAEPGHHDDLVMCLVLFAWATEQDYFKDSTNINTLHALKEKTEEDLEQDMTPFGFVITGKENYIGAFDDMVVLKSPDSWLWQEEIDRDDYDRLRDNF